MKIKRLRNFIAEKSSVIYGVAYNSTWKDSELIVFFENGSTYRYENVPFKVYSKLRKANLFKNKSVGKTFIKEVKNQPFIYTKIEESVK
tara:strand:+ start:6410 stop:6676 length:267 start_codon:yes stop_codon:yes gene_type:complete